MILFLMLFTLGFLVAVAIAAALAPIVWRQGGRVAYRRALATLPMHMSDIVAGRDHLRAAHAMSARRMEHSLNAARRELGEARIAVGHKAEVAARLDAELAAARASIARLEERERALLGEVETRDGRITDLEAARAALEEEGRRLNRQIEEVTATADSRRIEASALKAKVDLLRDRMELSERGTMALEGDIASFETKWQAFERNATESRKEAADHAARAAELARELSEAQLRVAELERQKAERGVRIAEQSADMLRLQNAIAALRERSEVSGRDRPRAAEPAPAAEADAAIVPLFSPEAPEAESQRVAGQSKG